MADTIENESPDIAPPAVQTAASRPSLSAEDQEAQDKEATYADIASLLKKHNPPPAVRGRKDTLDDRYFIKIDNLLPDYDKELAKACEAIDDNLRERRLYALVCSRELPYRLKNMEELLEFDHPNITQLVGAGTVEFSKDDHCRLVVVHERPTMLSLREVLAERKNPFPERYIIDEVIAPISDALKAFREKGVSHACINLDTVYLGEKVQLGECVSEPPGYAQHFLFESCERSQAMAMGKGETNTATDCYALGVLVLHMVMGVRAFERIEEHSYMNKRLTLGTYNALVAGKEFKGLDDFLKGVLNDDANERWTPDHIEQWVKGKKYNLLTPSVLREAQRPYDFMEEDYYNRRALAHSIARHWDEAKTLLRSTGLSRWVEVSLHKNDVAEALRRLVEKTGGIHSISERANNELVARTLCLLDPEGPVRYHMLSSFVDGLGVVLADAFRMKDQKRIQAVIEVIDYNFYNFVNELLSEEKAKKHSNLLWKMKNCSRYLRMQAMGFGIERILYELNPELPCQSPLLADENVLSIEGVMMALDRMGIKKNKKFEYLDRHVAAFIATKLDISKEVKLPELHAFPALAQNPQLIVLSLLAQAQRRAGRQKLRGLSCWACLRVLPLLDNFHSRSIRKSLRKELRNVAKSGDLDKIFIVLSEPHMLKEDVQGFYQAIKTFSKNAKEIEKLENSKRLKNKSRQIGIVMAMMISYAALLVTLIITIKNFYMY